MNRRLLAGAFILFCATPVLHASCGSSSCPLDTNALFLPFARGFTLDLSLQYIDQDQPQIGTRTARVGEMHGPHHDEVRTVNRIATAVVSYAPSRRIHLSASVPFISRDHDHLGSSHAHARGLQTQHNIIPQSWHLEGLGDIVLQARARVFELDPETQSRLWLIGGVKLPTGPDDLKNDSGQFAELPVQPGSGTTDGIAGVSFQSAFRMRSRVAGPLGNTMLVPWFITATYQFRTGDAHGYRFGNELQLNGGGVYSLTYRFDILMQLNARMRAKDDIAHEPDEEAFTGGTWVYASPGLRIALGSAAVYAIVQLPLYQDVNAIQLTSDRNYVVGLQTRF